MTPKTMRAVVFKGVKQIAVEERPIPTIQDPKDIIVKVRYTALCGRYGADLVSGTRKARRR
jgi:threonine dehydrogenase-like Zn-dependent dehydrogenase